MKRILLSINLAVLAVILCTVGTAAHNTLPGSWKVYSAFAPPATKTVETPQMVYYLSGGCLFSLDKSTQETFAYNRQNSLSDVSITDINYSVDDNMLVVAYASGNIDLIYDKDGSIVNIPDISLANIPGSKKINGVAFAPQRMYVATDFGLVEIDTQHYETVTSGNFSQPVTAVAVMGDYVVLNTGNKLYSVKRGERFNRIENLRQICSLNNSVEFYALDDVYLINRNNSTADVLVNRLKLNLADGKREGLYQYNADKRYKKGTYFTQAANGVRIRLDNDVFTLGEKGVLTPLYTLPDELTDDKVGMWNDDAVWGLNRDGLVKYQRGADGKWSIGAQRFRPDGMATNEVVYIIPSPDKKRVYFTNLGVTNYRMGYPTGYEGMNTVQTTTRLDEDGTMTDVTLYPVEALTSVVKGSQTRYGLYPISPTRLIEDPDDADTYYLGTGYDGLYKIKDGELVGRYNASNAPMAARWGWNVYDVNVDRAGNLWVVVHGLSDDESILVLPAAKRRLNPDDVSVDDWHVVKTDGFVRGNDNRLIMCQKSNMVILVSSHHVVVIDTRGTYDILRDDATKVWSSFTDQDGKEFAPEWFMSAVEDNDGRVWIGSSRGVIEFTRPSDAINNTFTVRRIKVPRNDGTDLADYLAGDDDIFDIAVDNANRKWLATATSGVYLTNSNGDKILENFNYTNSPLPDGLVNSVYADAWGNTVWFGTMQGLVEYGGTATPAHEDYNEISVFPNPVRPEYSGLVTITGLMHDSLVKIADAKGNVLYQTRAESGMVQWNVDNVAGGRVKTGVYYVFASENASGSSTGAVAKILVVN